MTRTSRRPAWALLLALALAGGCGYFNALYNAERRFADAERLEREGQELTAREAYEESLRKAAASYRAHPDGRWADDALLLIGRAHFALGRDAEAAPPLEQVRATSGDDRLRGVAAAYLGALAVRDGRAGEGLPRLDEALALLSADDDHAAVAHLWRGRALLRLGDAPGGWAALEAAAGGGRAVAREARLEAAARAAEAGDSVRLADAVARLVADGGARAAADSIRALAAAEGRRRGAAAAAALLAPVEEGAWPAAALDSLRLVRAGYLADAGDVRAEAELRSLADGAAAATAQRARHRWAQLRLREVRGLEELAEVRGILLPAVGFTPALRLVDHVRTVETLVGRAEEGRPLALFVAGELARDSLAAPALAGRLFATYAELVPDGVWTGKALLAAAAVAPPEEAAAHRRAAAALPPNPYTAPSDPLAFEDAERRLDAQLGGLLQEARATARLMDAAVTGHVATLDSIRLAARTDTLRIACGARLEAEAVVGIRADSARAACMRGDSARVAFVLALPDTLLLCDTLCAGSIADRERRVGRDTFPPLPGGAR